MELVIFDSEMGSESVQAVDGRTLHGQLGVQKDFTNWIKAQIRRGGLCEGVDYVISQNADKPGILLAQKGEQDSPENWGGSNREHYHLTLDAAKHIAMMSSTGKGREVRDYFIAVETELKNRFYDATPKSESYVELRKQVQKDLLRLVKKKVLNAVRDDLNALQQGEELHGRLPELTVAYLEFWFKNVSVHANLLEKSRETKRLT